MNSPAYLSEVKIRRAVAGDSPSVFTDIYLEDVNITIWQRQLYESAQAQAAVLLAQKPTLKASLTVSPSSALDSISEALGGNEVASLAQDMTELVDMFCCIFELKRVGLRLSALDKAMCPKFHVDRVPVRLVTTYHGVATEYIPHELVDRTKLGRRSNGQPDHLSGLYKTQTDVKQVNTGDVALLKGESWIGNEDAGLVHRSPVVQGGENRLLMTLDFSD